MSRLSVLLVSSCLLSVAARAEPVVVSQAGYLLGPSDAPLEGEHLLAFSLFAGSAPSVGETALWSGTYTVQVHGGTYAVELGSGATPLDGSLLQAGATRYLALSIDTGPELAPRLRLVTAPFAVDALRLGGRPASDYALASDLAALAGASGSTSLTTLGTITIGTWHGTPLADAYVASASTWNAKLATVAHDGTLSGTGAAGSPLGVVVGSAAGTVAAGNDARFAALDARLSALEANAAPGSGVSGSFSVTQVPDPYTVLLLNGEGASITDGSQHHHVVNVAGNVATSTAAFKYGTRSIRFGGASGGYLSIPWNAAFTVGSAQDFTIDYWANLDSTQPSSGCERIFQWGDNVTNGFSSMFCELPSNLYFAVGGYDDPGAVTTPMSTLTGAGWKHIAYVRSAGTLRMYVGGTQVSQSTNWTRTNTTGTPLYISTYPGSPTTGGYYLSGYLDEFRVSVGIARWTSNFTPPGASDVAVTKTVSITNGIVTAIQ